MIRLRISCIQLQLYHTNSYYIYLLCHIGLIEKQYFIALRLIVRVGADYCVSG